MLLGRFPASCWCFAVSRLRCLIIACHSLIILCAQTDLRGLEPEKIEQLQLFLQDDGSEPLGEHHVGTCSGDLLDNLYRMLLRVVSLEKDGPPASELVQEPRIQEKDLQPDLDGHACS